MAMSPNGVNALKQQFEQTARREHDEAQRTRKSSGTKTPPASRVVVVNKPSSGRDLLILLESKGFRISQRVGRACSPSRSPCLFPYRST